MDVVVGVAASLKNDVFDFVPGTMFLCLFRFSLGSPASSYSPKTCTMG